MKSNKSISSKMILFLFASLVLPVTGRSEFQPPPEMREKIEAVHKECKKELNGEKGPRAMMKLMKLKNEKASALSKKCVAALDELPPPPER